MALIDNELRSIWDKLRGARPHREDFLEEINIRNMRGIKDLRVPFGYPVTVLAGENACGKSTVLFGCAAAYKIPQSDAKKNAPSSLFPSFSKDDIDGMEGIELEYAYISQGQRMNMKWRRGKAWNKSFLGRKGASQPECDVYLRTLANLTNPSEVRSMLQIKQRQPKITEVSPEFLLLARRVLAFEYQHMSKVEKAKGSGDLLIAQLAGDRGKYSEFHMASGERSILRLSIEISKLENALVLIDEVETGLHPYIQKLLMLNLQRMALRQNLQVIVTTHSPVVLDCVPLEGRVFLSRDEQTHNVRVEKPMRDVLQKAMYGQSMDKLSIMCEDDISEAIIRGIVDALNSKMNFGMEHIFIGRNTGRDEFPSHVRALSKTGQLSDFIFVLDGDARESKERVAGAARGERAKVLFLPGNSCPERWVWEEIQKNYSLYEELLAISRLQEQMLAIEQQLNGAVGNPESVLFKGYLRGLSEQTEKQPTEIARMISRRCVEDDTGEIIDFVTEIQDAIDDWRTLQK